MHRKILVQGNFKGLFKNIIFFEKYTPLQYDGGINATYFAFNLPETSCFFRNRADMMRESAERVKPDTKPLNEVEGVNPLHHRLNPSLSDCLRTALLALTLFPIRFAGALLCFLLSYLVC